jgi:hypothetical protein
MHLQVVGGLQISRLNSQLFGQGRTWDKWTGEVGQHLEAEDLSTVIADQEQGLSVVEGAMSELRLAHYLRARCTSCQ